VDHGFRSGKIGRSKNNTGKAAKMFPRADRDHDSRLPDRDDSTQRAKSKYQVYSAEKKDFFDKFMAYADASVATISIGNTPMLSG